MKYNAFAREVEERIFSFRYIDSVKLPVKSNREMHEAFRVHFCDPFVCCPDLPVQEFLSYLTDFPRLREAEAASCEVVATECEVRDVKQVSHNKSPRLDGLS